MKRAESPAGVRYPPDGVNVRTCDGTEADVIAFNQTYNRAFAEHYHYVVFREWGAKLEQALFGAPNMVATQENGDQTSPNETRSLQLHTDSATQRAIEVDTLEKAKANHIK